MKKLRFALVRAASVGDYECNGWYLEFREGRRLALRNFIMPYDGRDCLWGCV